MEWKRSYTDKEMLTMLRVVDCRDVLIAQTRLGFLIAGVEDDRYGPVTTYMKEDGNYLCAYRFKSMKPPKKQP